MIFLKLGGLVMEKIKELKTPETSLLCEIKYFALFSALKKLSQQGKLTTAYCQKANVAIAEKYGVLQYPI